MSKYKLELCSEKIFYIFCLIVRFQRSITEHFSSFSVEYNLIIYCFKISSTYLLLNYFPLSVHKNLGTLSFNNCLYALATDSPFLFFTGTIHSYLEKMSIIIRRYLYPSFHLLNFCTSTRSAPHSWSNPMLITRRRGNFLFTGLWSSSAKSAFHNSVCCFLFQDQVYI